MRRSDIHAPDSVRVNAALSQMQEFANTFLSEPIPSHPSLTLHLLTCPHPSPTQVQAAVRAVPCTRAHGLVAKYTGRCEHPQ